jgi:hypothetical protein
MAQETISRLQPDTATDLPVLGSAGVHPPSRFAGLRRTGPAGTLFDD